MSMTGAEIMAITRAGLESGLRVRHIATFDPLTCDDTQLVADVTSDALSKGFDCLPVRSNGRVIGYFEPKRGIDEGTVADFMVPLDGTVLVSADESLATFLPMLHGARFKLVVSGRGIEGIVTRSDLQKLPVRLFAFALITHFEMTMRAAIIALLPQDETWLDLLGVERRSNVKEKWQSLRRSGLDPAIIEATDFCDKRDILRKHLHLGRPFDRDLHGIEKVRNSIPHAGTYGETDERVQNFIACLHQTEQWIAHIEHEVESRTGRPMRLF